MKLLNICVSLAVVSSLFFASSVVAAPNDKAGADKGPPKVDVFIVAPAKDREIPLEFPARLVSMQDAVVMARATGVLQKKYYTEGRYVQKGDLLYKIEPDSYAANVESAKANLQLENVKFEKAQKDWQRADALFKDKAISEQEKEGAYYAYQTAKASVSVAKAALRKVSVDLVQALISL